MNVNNNFSLSQWLGNTRRILFVDSSGVPQMICKSTGISEESNQLGNLGSKVTLAELQKQLKNVAVVVDSNPFRLAEFSRANPSIARIFFDKHHRYFECTSKERSPLALACLANAHGVLVSHPSMSSPGQIDTIFADAVDRCARKISMQDLLLENNGGGIRALCSLYGLGETSYDEDHPCPPSNYAWEPKPDWIALSKGSQRSRH